MHETLFMLLGARVTAWKLIGYLGVALFTSRWFVQMWASKRAGKPVMPITFWVLSVLGSLLCLMYFIFGKNDSVGILAYAFPTVVASYNLALELSHRKNNQS